MIYVSCNVPERAMISIKQSKSQKSYDKHHTADQTCVLLPKYPNSMKRWKDNWDAVSPNF